MEQRLAAVLAADMAGYSRLMEADEQGTLARLRTSRIELVDPAIVKNNGRIIKTTGDGMLVEFQSVVEALNCALEVQERMRRRNADVPEDRRIQFRIGINVGDIIFDDGDIYGDGVNVAARLEQMAEIGGVLVSAAVFEQVVGKLELQFEDLGEKVLKNISRPFRVYRAVLPLPERTGASSATKDASKKPGFKPTIAVLPFANMSGDAEQEFFVDGLTEDILTELSRRHELFVISRNSTFVYKKQAVNIREVAQKLGAQYVVEGSVRKAGDRLRVTVQLIDTTSDAHIWAERYDRKLEDVFELQDEVTTAIVATLPGRVEAAQYDLLARKKPHNMAAYECLLSAKVLHHRSTREDNVRALERVERAIELDPQYAHAHAWRGCIIGQAWGYGWVTDPDGAVVEVTRSLETAYGLDENDADVHRILAAVHIMQNDHVKAQHHQERALALNPNYDLVVVQMGELLTWLGRADEGVEWILKAMRLNPHHPARFWSHLGRAYYTGRQYRSAIDAFMKVMPLECLQHAFLASSHGMLGNASSASLHLRRACELNPDFTVENFLSTMHFANESDHEHLREGLAKAGNMPC
jgi:adenylate cyclase